ncbi:hypothetical protein EBZ80_25820, partial [bacterium]|nr:hypothetical protein [bacterium]
GTLQAKAREAIVMGQMLDTDPADIAMIISKAIDKVEEAQMIWAYLEATPPEELAEEFGFGRNHPIFAYAVRVAESMFDGDPEFATADDAIAEGGGA